MDRGGKWAQTMARSVLVAGVNEFQLQEEQSPITQQSRDWALTVGHNAIIQIQLGDLILGLDEASHDARAPVQDRPYWTTPAYQVDINYRSFSYPSSSSQAINDKNHGRQTVSAQSMTQCRTAITFKASKQFRVLPIVICSLITSLSLVFVTTSRCQSWP